MSNSNERVRALIAFVLAVAAVALCSPAPPRSTEGAVGTAAPAPHPQSTEARQQQGDLGAAFELPRRVGQLRIYESTFNEFAAAVGTLHHEDTPDPIRLCAFGVCLTLCSGTARSEASDLRFHLHATSIDVTGKIVTRWCGQRVNSDLAGNAQVSLNPQTESIQVVAVTRVVNPRFVITIPDSLGDGTIEVPMPFSINVGPSLSQYAIPIRQTTLSFQTSRGRRTLKADSRDLSLAQGEGYIEIGGEVVLW